MNPYVKLQIFCPSLISVSFFFTQAILTSLSTASRRCEIYDDLISESVEQDRQDEFDNFTRAASLWSRRNNGRVGVLYSVFIAATRYSYVYSL